MRILLASKSPRRKLLLRLHNINFSVIENKLRLEPSLTPGNLLYTQLQDLAKKKAIASADAYSDWVLSADTVVVHSGRILGKPCSEEGAVDMVHSLSNDVHEVVTGICLYHPKTLISGTCVDSSHVYYSDISRSDIVSYVQKHTPLDKAGGYGIQDVPSFFIKKIEGDLETIVGLRVQSVIHLYASLNQNVI